MDAPIVCWRCERPGHAAADCQPPPAQTKKELYARIDRYVDRWIAGDIRPEQKRAWIASELKMYDPKEKAK